MKKQLGLTSGSVAKRIEKYDFQFELFDRVKLSRTCAERNKFVLTDEAVAALNRGDNIQLDELKNYKLIKRERPVKIYETGNGGYGANFSYAGNIAGLCEMTKDETKLFLSGQTIGSVETHETTPFAAL